MNHFLHGLVASARECFDFPGPTVEIGSYLVAGQEPLGDLRPLFRGQEYLGLDFRTGPGVDALANAMALPLASQSVGTLVALSLLEHVEQFWIAAKEIQRVLKPNGIAIISIPFYFHIHGYPDDFWRVTPNGLEKLFEGFPHRVIGWQGETKRPLHVFGLMWGPEAAPPSLERITKLGRLLSKCPREPLSRPKELAFRVLAPLLGRRVFSPWLDRNRWTLRFRSNPALPDLSFLQSESPIFIQSHQPE